MRKPAITGQRHNKAWSDHSVTIHSSKSGTIKYGKPKMSKKERLRKRKEAKLAGTQRQT